MTIHVHANNTISLGGQPVKLSELLERLKDLHVRYPLVTPQLFHDKKAHFGTYQEIKNALEESGYEKVDVILKPY